MGKGRRTPPLCAEQIVASRLEAVMKRKKIALIRDERDRERVRRGDGGSWGDELSGTMDGEVLTTMKSPM